MKITITDIESEIIEDIEYNREKRELIISFRKGGTYLYSEVPSLYFIKFIGASSCGKFFHRIIKNSFACERL